MDNFSRLTGNQSAAWGGVAVPAKRKRAQGRNDLGFTPSHLRRVPELLLLASRIVRAEMSRRGEADGDSVSKGMF